MDLEKNKKNFETVTKTITNNIINGIIVPANSNKIENLSINEILTINQQNMVSTEIISVLTKFQTDSETFYGIIIPSDIDMKIHVFVKIDIDGIEFDYDSKQMELIIDNNKNVLKFKTNLIGTDNIKFDLKDYVDMICKITLNKINLIETEDTGDSENDEGVENE